MSQLREAVASGITHAVITEAMSAETKKKLKKAGIAAGTIALLAAGGRAYQTKDSKTGIAQSTGRALKAISGIRSVQDAKNVAKSTASGVRNKVVRDYKSLMNKG